MNLWRTFKTALRSVKAWYEAGFPLLTGDRSYVPSLVQDMRYDAPSFTRREMIRKTRYFEQNNGIAQRLGHVYQQYTVGANGLHLQPNSSDKEWNKRAKAAFLEWCGECDYMGVLSLSAMQNVGSLRQFFDGEIFFNKTFLPTKRGSRPRLQMIESHRVETPPEKWADEGTTVCDGVSVDEEGRKLRYWARDGFNFTRYVPVEAANMIHVGEASRVNEYRHITRLHSVLNDLHQLDDLQKLELSAAADAAEKSTFITSPAGEGDPNQLRARRYLEPQQPGETPQQYQERVDYFRKVMGGRTAYLKTGQEVKQFVPLRPSEATLNLWNFLTSKICWGVGMPKVVVFSEYLETMQGTVVRSDLEIANAFFRTRSRVWGDFLYQAWCFWGEWARYNDLRVVDAPADWQNVTVHPPRAVNVDQGRNSTALLQEIAAGCANWEMWFSPLGLDWREQFDKLKEQQDYAKEIGLIIILPGSNPSGNTGNSWPPADEEDPAAKPAKKPKEKPELATA